MDTKSKSESKENVQIKYILYIVIPSPAKLAGIKGIVFSSSSSSSLSSSSSSRPVRSSVSFVRSFVACSLRKDSRIKKTYPKYIAINLKLITVRRQFDRC